MEETVLNKRRCIAMLLGVLCLFGACAGGALRQGTWQDGVFTNKWAGIRFAAGEGERALDAAEMREWTGGAAGAAYNDPAAKPDWGETALFYDCILLLGAERCSVQVIYGNLRDWPDTDEAAYAAMLRENFERLTAAEYAYQGETAAEIAGRAYTCHEWTVNGEVCQRMYLRRQGKAMICIATSCPAKSRAQVDEFLAGVQDPAAK